MVYYADPVFTGGYIKATLLDPHPGNNYDRSMNFYDALVDEVGQAAVTEYQRQQDIFQDPQVVVPNNVMEVEVYYQHTLVNDFPLNTISHVSEAVLNLWGEGENDNTIVNNSGHAIHWGNLTNEIDQLLGLIGHSEVHDWYYLRVVQEGLTFGDFVAPLHKESGKNNFHEFATLALLPLAP
jgi:hypothetical protein